MSDIDLHRELMARATEAFTRRPQAIVRLWISEQFPELLDELPGEVVSKNALLDALCKLVLHRGMEAELRARLDRSIARRGRARLLYAALAASVLAGGALAWLTGRSDVPARPIVEEEPPAQAERSELCGYIEAEKRRVGQMSSAIGELALVCDPPEDSPGAGDVFAARTGPDAGEVMVSFPDSLSDLVGTEDVIRLAVGDAPERRLLAEALVRFALIEGGHHPERMTCLAADPEAGDAGVFASLTNLMSWECPGDVSRDEEFLARHCVNSSSKTWQCAFARHVYVEHHPNAVDIAEQVERLFTDFAGTRIASIARLKLARRACEAGAVADALTHLGALEREIAESADCPRMWLASIASCLLDSSALDPAQAQHLRELEAHLDTSKCRMLELSQGGLLAVRGYRREMRGDYAAAGADYRRAYALTREPGYAWRTIEMALHDAGEPSPELCAQVLDPAIQSYPGSPGERFYGRFLRYIAARRGCVGMRVATEAAALVEAYRGAPAGAALVGKQDASARRILCDVEPCALFELLTEPVDPGRLPALRSAVAPL